MEIIIYKNGKGTCIYCYCNNKTKLSPRSLLHLRKSAILV